MAGKRLLDVSRPVVPKSSYSLAASGDRELEPFLQATGRHSSHPVGTHMSQRSAPFELHMHTSSPPWQQQPSSTSSSQQEHGSMFNRMPTDTQSPTASPDAAAAAAHAGTRTLVSMAIRCRQQSDDGEEVTSLPSTTAAAVAAVAAAFAATGVAAAPAVQPATCSPPVPAAAAAPEAQQEQEQQEQAAATSAVPQAAALPAGCRVLLSKVLTRSDANAKRVILRCKQVESTLGSRPVGQGHKLTVGLPCGSSCLVVVRAWANGNNTKPMYVLEQVDTLFRQEQLAVGDTVSLLVSGDGRQHFLRWQRAGEAAGQLPAAEAEIVAEPVAAALPVKGTGAAVAATELAAPAPTAEVLPQPCDQLPACQVQQQEKKEVKKRQQQELEVVLPVQQQFEPAVQQQHQHEQPPPPQQQQQQQQQLVPEVGVQSQPQVVVADKQQSQDELDSSLLLLPLIGSSAMDCVLRTGCYLLCLQQGCMQPACLGCMGCAAHKRRRVA